LDPPLVGVRRDVGPLLLVWRLLEQLELVATIDAALPRSARSQVSVGEVVAALIASRLCSPSPLYDVAGWASGAALQELLGIPAPLLNDDRLGRALETFAVHAEGVRGLIAARAIERFGLDSGRLHVDLTTVRVTGESRRLRVAYIHSSEEAREVRAARDRALAKAEEQLARVKRGLGGRHYKTKAQVERRVGQIIGANVAGLIVVKAATRAGKPTLSYERDEQAIRAAAGTDGIYALATNLPGRLSAGRVLELYKDQQIVERRHRDLKQTLKVRPIFLHNDDRIYALISTVGIALPIFGLIESETRRALGDDEQLPRSAARRPRRQTHRPQHPHRLPRPRPHLHARRHHARPPNPHPAAHP
jgi:Domain of unknown function (DUF4277)